MSTIGGGGKAKPGGTNQQVQFNDAGVFQGDAGLLYDKATGGLIIGGRVTARGLTFPATQVASSDPYTLDDYREGTWTPTINGDGGSSGQTYSSQQGHYIKIGRMVAIQASVQLSSKGTIVGNVYMGGCPFPCMSGMSGLLAASGITATTYSSLGAYFNPNNPNIFFARVAAGGGSGGALLIGTDLGNTSSLSVGGVFFTNN